MITKLNALEQYRATIAAILPHGTGKNLNELSFGRRYCDKAAAAGATWESLMQDAFPAAFTPPLVPTATLSDVIVAALTSQRGGASDDFDVELTLANILRDAEFEHEIMSTFRREEANLQTRREEETKARAASGKMQKEIAALQKQPATPATDAAIVDVTQRFNRQLLVIDAARHDVAQATDRYALAAHIFPASVGSLEDLLEARGVCPDGTTVGAPLCREADVLPGGRPRKVNPLSMHRLAPSALNSDGLRSKMVEWEHIEVEVKKVMDNFAGFFRDARNHHMDIVTRANDVAETDALLRAPEADGWSAEEKDKVRARLDLALYGLYTSCHRGQRIARGILDTDIWGVPEYSFGSREEDPSFFEHTNYFPALNDRLQRVVEQLYCWMETEQELILHETALNNVEERFTAAELYFLNDTVAKRVHPGQFETSFKILLPEFKNYSAEMTKFGELSDRAVETFKVVFEQRGPAAGRGEPVPPLPSKDFGYWSYDFATNYPRELELRVIRHERERLAVPGAPRYGPARVAAAVREPRVGRVPPPPPR